MVSTSSLPSLRKTVSWSALGNLANAASQFLLLFLLARVGTPELVGQYGLGVALATPVFLLTSLGLRNAQVVDSENKYSFLEYAALRLISTVCAMLLLLGIAGLLGYSGATGRVILLLGLVRSGEGVSDVVFGAFQKVERMDLVGKSMIAKAMLSAIAFAVALFVTNSLSIGLVAIFGAWLVRFFFVDLRHVLKLRGKSTGILSIFSETIRVKEVIVNEPRRLLNVARSSLLVGMSSALVALNTNVPRYALEWIGGTYVLGIFTVLSYPVSAGNLVINSMSQAFLPRLSRLLGAEDPKEFSSFVKTMLVAGATVAAITLVTAAVVGERFLTTVFGQSYGTYYLQFMVLALGVGFDFPNWFLNAALLSMKESRLLVLVQVTVLIVTFFASVFFIPVYGLQGAVWVVTGSIIAQSVAKLVIVWRKIRSRGQIRASVQGKAIN